MKKHIFVLEDDQGLRELFTILFEDEEFEVSTFPNVYTFKQGLQQQKPNLIIMDVMLPDGNGLDVCQEVKASEATRHIPIIMMSAHRDFSLDRGNSPAEEFIPKPFEIDYLLEKVNQYA